MSEFIINYCRRDNIWIVQRRTARRKNFYITIAECFTEQAAEILLEGLNNQKK